jgi:hypothetical protein
MLCLFSLVRNAFELLPRFITLFSHLGKKKYEEPWATIQATCLLQFSIY